MWAAGRTQVVPAVGRTRGESRKSGKSWHHQRLVSIHWCHNCFFFTFIKFSWDCADTILNLSIQEAPDLHMHSVPSFSKYKATKQNYSYPLFCDLGFNDSHFSNLLKLAATFSMSIANSVHYVTFLRPWFDSVIHDLRGSTESARMRNRLSHTPNHVLVRHHLSITTLLSIWPWKSSLPCSRWSITMD